MLDANVTGLTVRIGSLETGVGEFKREVRSEFAAVRGEMAAEFADVRHEMRTGFTALEYQIDASIGASETRMQRLVQDTVKASEEATHRHMRVLHEEVLERISRLGDARR